MSRSILIIGESGSGKTTSMRNLNENETIYFDCDKKGLSWKGWKKQYNLAAKKNYFKTSLASEILTYITAISEKRPNIKNIVIDTLNAIMIDDERAKINTKGYDKWQDMAFSIYDICCCASNLRDNLNVICVMHSQTERDDFGNEWTRPLVSGRKLDKIKIESKFTTVLLAKLIDGEYVFETCTNKSVAKAPMGAFAPVIPNDIKFVLDTLEKYENDGDEEPTPIIEEKNVESEENN